MTPRSAKKIALKMCKPFYADNGFARWIFPVIRNINPAANVIDQLVSVQPMNEPSNQTFYLDFVRNSWWERFKRWLRWHLKIRDRRRRCRGVGLVFML